MIGRKGECKERRKKWTKGRKTGGWGQARTGKNSGTSASEGEKEPEKVGQHRREIQMER